MSFSIPNCGRYRVNAYKQRGSVALAFRLVGTKVPSPEELGVPESVIDLYQRKRGLVWSPVLPEAVNLPHLLPL